MLKKVPHRYFVTFFDANYIPRALVTYWSLAKYHNNFSLYAFCFDDISYDCIKSLGYKNFIAVHTSEFENKELLRCKATKQKFYEYYWSCKPFLVRKVMNDTGADMVTYIDCDFMFFDSPEVIFSEMGNADVLIQPNNFSYDEEKQFLPVGYYCSCFEAFKNNTNGRKVLNWWHKRCMEWCFARFENNKFADQKYLDDWRIRFKGVREITNVGANVAPWSVQKYDLSKRNGRIYVNTTPLVYYHYHSFKMNLDDYKYIITGDRENFYRITKDVKTTVYPPYVKYLKKAILRMKKNPVYKKYCLENPKSLVKMTASAKKLEFSSYKVAAEELKLTK